MGSWEGTLLLDRAALLAICSVLNGVRTCDPYDSNAVAFIAVGAVVCVKIVVLRSAVGAKLD